MGKRTAEENLFRAIEDVDRQSSIAIGICDLPLRQLVKECSDPDQARIFARVEAVLRASGERHRRLAANMAEAAARLHIVLNPRADFEECLSSLSAQNACTVN